MKTTDEKIVFAIAPSAADGGPSAIIVGIPAAAWDYMKDGKTHNFDLTSVGLQVRFMLFGAKDHSDAMKQLEQGAAHAGVVLDDRRRQDFSIKEKHDG
jgi:hypothetical protein